MIICYTVPEIWHMTDVIFVFHFGLFLPFYAPTAQKIKIKKKKYGKLPGDIMIICYTVPEIWGMMGVIFIFHFGLFFALLLP